jgi:chromosome partitioning protein
MPVLAVASPKGGAGKTTTAVVLATTLAEMGASVIIFDCDRNKPIAKRWGTAIAGLPIEIIQTTDELDIVDKLDEARTRAKFVICDLEGAGSLLMSRAVGRSQFVVIPLQPSDLDADEAAKAVRLVRAEEKSFGRQIAHRVLWTRTPVAVKSTLERELVEEVRANNIPCFETQLHDRQPYRAIFRKKVPLSALPRTKATADQIDKARENARTLVNELISYLVPAKEMAA